MSKTPEQMAEEAIKWVKTLPPASERCNQCACEGYRAGYKAAQDQVADVSKVTTKTVKGGEMKTIEEIIKDHDANTSKLIKPTDTAGKEELNCMIAHFENEDYKILVMVPGILPKADGGELVRGCGLIVYDIWKKVTK